MARTPDQILAGMVAQLSLQNAQLLAEVERLREQLATATKAAASPTDPS